MTPKLGWVNSGADEDNVDDEGGDALLTSIVSFQHCSLCRPAMRLTLGTVLDYKLVVRISLRRYYQTTETPALAAMGLTTR